MRKIRPRTSRMLSYSDILVPYHQQIIDCVQQYRGITAKRMPLVVAYSFTRWLCCSKMSKSRHRWYFWIYRYSPTLQNCRSKFCICRSCICCFAGSCWQSSLWALWLPASSAPCRAFLCPWRGCTPCIRHHFLPQMIDLLWICWLNFLLVKMAKVRGRVGYRSANSYCGSPGCRLLVSTRNSATWSRCRFWGLPQNRFWFVSARFLQNRLGFVLVRGSQTKTYGNWRATRVRW